MKILFLNQFFWPDSSATSQQLTDLAAGLADRGHDVHVLCGSSGYSSVQQGSEAPPVTIHRVPSMPFARGRVGRILSYASFYPFALLRALSLPKMDVVVSLTTPPLLSVVGTLLKALRGSRHYIWEQDIYPDVAVSLGVIRGGSFADRAVGRIGDVSRRHADGLLSLGRCMTQRLVGHGVDRTRIHLTENWSSASSIVPMPRPGSRDETVLLYSGNLGLAHDLDTLLAAMNSLREDRRFRFVFVGGGGRRKELERSIEANGLSTVELRGYVPRDQLSEGLAIGDIGIVLQSDSCWGLVVPSKLYGIMAAARPVLFVGPANATPARTVREHGCGWHIESGDTAGLVALLQYLAERPQEVAAAGARAREALLRYYDQPIGIERIARVLEGGDFSTSTPVQPTANPNSASRVATAPRRHSISDTDRKAA